MQNIPQYITDYLNKTDIQVPGFAEDIRRQAKEEFLRTGLPDRKNENWRHTPIAKAFAPFHHTRIHELHLHGHTDSCRFPEDDDFYKLNIVNAHLEGHDSLKTLENGVIVGRLTQAFHEHPELVKEYFHRLMKDATGPIDALNTAGFSEGIFLYVPDGVKFNIEVGFLLDTPVDAMWHMRNLIITGDHAEVNWIQCDDSNAHRKHLVSFYSEIFTGENSAFNLYKYQNINRLSQIISRYFHHVRKHARIHTYLFELNGGLLRNAQNVRLAETQSEARMYGIYLADEHQQFDNLIEVRHEAPHTFSEQKFKGILDDSARGFFNGKIQVAPQADRTQAYQKNDHLLLTDKAMAFSQPFLEIYADDVQCSHGSATGQMDENALFYIRQRGISERDARLLQLYAFTGEIIDRIPLSGLRDATKDLVKKRLNGELDACENCILQCNVKNDNLIYE